MKVNNINYQNKNTVFGYGLPKYCDYKKTILTENFINEVCQKKLAQGSEVYAKYVTALENFKNKRSNLEPLDELYSPQIEKLSKWEKLLYKSYISEFCTPRYEVIKKEPQTHEVKTPLKNLWNFLTGNPQRNKKVTKIVNVPEQRYDLSKIDATLDGVKFARYGSIFTGDNPAEDFWEIQVGCGRKYPIIIDQFSRETDYFAEKANKRLQSILSDADSIEELGNEITAKLEERFKYYCEQLKKDYQDRLNNK